MTDETNSTTVTIGVELLQVAFIVLKLTHVIDWSWWWVLSPTWIPIALVLMLLLLLVVIELVRHD